MDLKRQPPVRLFVAAVAIAVAAAAPSGLLAAETLRYAVFPAPPYMVVDESVSPPAVSGIDVQIMREAAGRAGVELEFVPAPWARCLDLLKRGGADLLSSVYRTPEREAFLAYFPHPYLDELPIAFYTLAGSGQRLMRYEDLQTVGLVGVLRGAAYYPRFDADAAIRKHPVTTQEQLYPLLLAGRIQAFAGYVWTEAWFIRRLGLEGKVVQSGFVERNPASVYFASSRSSPRQDAIARLSRAYEDLQRSGRVAAIVRTAYRELGANGGS